MIKIAAVIVAYNRPEMLRVCLSAVLRQTRPLNEIIVVDNSDNNECEDVVRSGFSSVTYLHFAENTGSAGGYYEGIKIAVEHNHWVWTLDDDTVVEENTLKEVLSYIPSLEKKGKLAAFRTNYHGKLGEIAETNGFPWSGTFIKTEIITRIGLPDKRYFLYAEDIEYSWRMIKFGYKIYRIPAGKLSEIKSSSRNRRYYFTEPFRLYYTFRNQLFLYLKYRRFIKFVRQLIYGFRGVLYFCLRGKTDLSRAIISGIWHGLKGKLGKNDNYRVCNANLKSAGCKGH